MKKLLGMSLVVFIIGWCVWFVYASVTRTQFEKRKARAFYERILAPGYGICGRCERPWKYTQGHSTPFFEEPDIEGPEGRPFHRWGMFPLCEYCWSELTPEMRLPYYKKLWWSGLRDHYGRPSSQVWEELKKNVLDGM